MMAKPTLDVGKELFSADQKWRTTYQTTMESNIDIILICQVVWIDVSLRAKNDLITVIVGKKKKGDFVHSIVS